MTYTRRSFLRDAAIVSSTATVSPILTGCERNHFDNGIRIFFAGAWIFCGIPGQPNLMHAITLDPSEPTQPGTPASMQCQPPQTSAIDMTSMKHTFPHGVWDQAGNWDTSSKRGRLCANPQSAANSLIHSVSVDDGNWSHPQSLDALFMNSNKDSSFAYLSAARNSSNKGQPYNVNLAQTNLRIVTVPRPTRIIPAAFRPDVKIADPNNRLEPAKNSKDTGLATTHIFEYKGASKLAFTPGDGKNPGLISQGGKDFNSDYHFHSVPTIASIDHAPMMFNQLISLIVEIKCSLLINRPCPPQRPVPGASVPISVTQDELEMTPGANAHLIDTCDNKKVIPFRLTLASCCSGAVGVDTCGC
ncbi:hypothetical protein [Granulicella mallensis]|uniref:Uncharacterized protein n=1 Tax=Granulicella mallensis (strain ATCC BAA-1857 / DSM 23137 / MP5ACTX8) TaxID=682795 RepID=G8NPM1_GRAMM|nr:hypothetical protein [Granulicella mallensis]AEU36033.1 hypothetical protein AciX8_1694 [Granulicella mallensis MP5ACTX8]